MKRIAPETGYDFEAKAKYRKIIWDCFSKNVSDPGKSKVGFLPSQEGLEIPLAIERGFKEKNLFAIDRNRALLRHAKWRRRYPKVKTYGSELPRAGERIRADNHRLDAVNLDLCGNISIPTIRAIRGFIESDCLKSQSVVAMTLMNGRENNRELIGMMQIIADITDSPNDRIERS